jgi:hypothetical protein
MERSRQLRLRYFFRHHIFGKRNTLTAAPAQTQATTQITNTHRTILQCGINIPITDSMTNTYQHTVRLNASKSLTGIIYKYEYISINFDLYFDMHQTMNIRGLLFSVFPSTVKHAKYPHASF